MTAPFHADGERGTPPPVSRLPVRPGGPVVPVVSQARAAFDHAKAAVAADWAVRTQEHGGMVNGAINWQPPTIAGQMEYARKALWVPPGHERGLFERAGRRYQKRIGVPGVALGAAIIGIFHRGIAAFIAGVLATALIAAVLCTAVFHGHHVAAVIGGALGAWVLLLAYLFVPSRAERRSRS